MAKLRKQVTMAKLVLVSKRRKIQLLVRVAKFVTRSIPFEVVFVMQSASLSRKKVMKELLI